MPMPVPMPMVRRYYIGGTTDERSDINANKLRQFSCVVCVCLPWPLEYFIISFFVLPTPPSAPKKKNPFLGNSGSFSGIR